MLKKLSLAIAIGAFCSQSLLWADTVKIAIAGPVTGPVAQYGDMVRLGTDMAIKRINAAGGVNGKQLEAVVLDDACEPKQAVTVANKVVADGIQFVVGHVCTGAIMPASEIYGNEGIIMITPSGTGPQITEEAYKKGYKTIFRMIGRDDQQGPAAANFIAETIKPSKVAIIHDKQSYGQGIATSVQSELKKHGVEVVLFEGLNKSDNDFSALITKIKGTNADFVYFGGYHDVMGLLLRQAREQGLNAKFMGPEGVGSSDIFAIAGDAVEGMLFTFPKDFSQDPRNADLIQAYRDAKQDPSGAFVMPGYASVLVMAEAMKATQSEDPEKIIEYLRQNTIETPIGNVSYDEKGDLKDFEFVVFSYQKDGSKQQQ